MKIIKATFLLVIITLLQGCASFLKTIEVGQVKDGQTIIVGKLTLERLWYRSGILINRETIPFKSVSLGIKSFGSSSEIPRQIISYSDVKRVLVDDSFNILTPIDAANYFVVDVHASPEKLLGNYTFQDFSRKKGVMGTLQLNVLDGVANYIGHVHVVEIREEYEDINNNGYIDASEFSSNITTFAEVSEGKDSFKKGTTWRAFSFSVRDEMVHETFPFKLKKSLAEFIRY